VLILSVFVLILSVFLFFFVVRVVAARAGIPFNRKSFIPGFFLLCAVNPFCWPYDLHRATEITALPIATKVLSFLLQGRLDLASWCMTQRA